MHINKIENQTFTSAEPKKRSALGKWLGLGISTGCLGRDIYCKGGFKKFAEEFHLGFAKTLENEFNAQNNKMKIDKLTTPKLKNMSNLNILGAVAGLIFCCVAVGEIFDEVVNFVRNRG